MKIKNIAWGLFFLSAAALVILSRTSVLEGMSFWSLIISLLMVPIIVKSLSMMAWGGVLIPISVILIAFDDYLGIEKFTPLPILGCALFLSIALHIFFPYKRSWQKGFQEHIDINLESNPDGVVWSEEKSDGEHLYFSSRFTECVKYIGEEPFSDVNIRTSFGGTKIYFDSAVMKTDTGVINIDANFSGVELYIPKAWTVISNVSCSFGGVDEKGLRGSAKDGKTLRLNGRARFSGVTVHYI